MRSLSGGSIFGTGAEASRADIEQEYQTVKFSGTAFASWAGKEAITRLRISDDAIDALGVAKLTSFESTLLGRPPFANLDGWPADAQLGLFSMASAIGPLFRLPKFEAAAATEDWLTMAHECKISETGSPGIILRNVRNGLLFTIANWMAAPPAGDFSGAGVQPFAEAGREHALRKLPDSTEPRYWRPDGAGDARVRSQRH